LKNKENSTIMGLIEPIASTSLMLLTLVQEIL